MQTLSTLTLSAIAIAFPSAQDDPEAPALSFQPKVEAGQQFAGAFTVNSEAELVESRQTQNGEEMGGDMGPDISRSSAESITLEFTEKFVEAEEGAPSVIERTYADVAGEFEFAMNFGGGGEFGEAIDESGELESDLGEETVRFTLEGDEFVASPSEDSELEGEDVEGLRADMSLGLFAPADDMPIKKGGEWGLPGTVLKTILDYPGDLRLEGPEGNHGPMKGLEPDEEDEGEIEGELTLTYTGIREVEGRTFAVVKIAGAVAESIDSVQEVEMMVDGGGGEKSEVEISVVTQLEPEGELLWDIELGLFVSLELTVEVSSESTDMMSFDIPGMVEIEIEQTELDETTIELAYSRSVVE